MVPEFVCSNRAATRPEQSRTEQENGSAKNAKKRHK
jgi:hypothetical protein